MNKAWNSTLRASTKPLRTKKPWEPKGGMSRPQKPTTSKKKPMASRGMKGRPVTAEQKRFHGQLAALGCAACRVEGREQMEVSIHHIDGRTKPNAHWHVLPLCAGHHQDGTDAPGLIAVHPWKKRFEAAYGTEYELLATCLQQIKEIPAAARTALGAIQQSEAIEC